MKAKLLVIVFFTALCGACTPKMTCPTYSKETNKKEKIDAVQQLDQERV